MFGAAAGAAMVSTAAAATLASKKRIAISTLLYYSLNHVGSARKCWPFNGGALEHGEIQYIVGICSFWFINLLYKNVVYK